MCRLHIFVLDGHLATLFGFLLVMFPLGSSYFVFVFLSLWCLWWEVWDNCIGSWSLPSLLIWLDVQADLNLHWAHILRDISWHCDISLDINNVNICTWAHPNLTLVLLNKLRCHAYFQFSANQVTWSSLLIQIHILNGKQCRSRSVGFFRSQLIWIYTVCKCRVYPGSAGQGLNMSCITSEDTNC